MYPKRTRTRRSLEDRFWSKVFKAGDDDCWNWLGATLSHGHGIIATVGTKKDYVHRLSYRWAKGEIPTGMLVRHLCGNPRCVNPNHLALGTNQDNANDSVKHRAEIYAMAGYDESARIKDALGRLAKRWGLADFEVEDIAEELKKGYRTGEIARRYRVHVNAISRIRELTNGIAPRTVKERSQSYSAVVT